MEDAAIYARAGWFQATARQRIAGLLDPNSFTEFLGPSERIQSPHLHLFDLPSAFDDGMYSLLPRKVNSWVAPLPK